MLPILKHYLLSKYFRKFRDRKELETWQHKQVVKHLQKIVPQSIFYQEFYQGLNWQNWRDFPSIDKHTMMERFDDLNTVGIKKEAAFELAMECDRSREFSPKIGNITVGLSSGTSGSRGLFLVNPSEQFEWAGTLLAKTLPGTIMHKHSVALFMRANSNLYETTRTNRIHFQFYDLLQPLDMHVEQLNHTPPTILAAPPSMLRFLSHQKNQGRLHISPSKVISLAEVLDPLDETFIRKAFGQQIHQIYQCTEGFLGVTCSLGTLHLNEDVVAIQQEFIDKEARKFVPIVTDFRRTSQPIIRYRLNDILTERQTPCPCGSCFIALEKIEGRCDDIFYLPSLAQPEKLIPLFPDYIRNAITETDLVEEYLVVQRDANYLEVAVKSKAGNQLDSLIKASLQRLCLRHQCRLPHLKFVPYVETTRDKKLRRIRRDYAPILNHQ
ncbi:MAG: adenylate cyclase [Parachlamydia sp.]|nr:MAG: adenylate cyclase [Parachlamydia sp.]